MLRFYNRFPTHRPPRKKKQARGDINQTKSGTDSDIATTRPKRPKGQFGEREKSKIDWFPGLSKISHMCHWSPVSCHMSPSTCHQHQQPQPQTFPLLTPSICAVVHQDRTNKTLNQFKTQNLSKHSKKGVLSFSILAIHSLTRILHLSWFCLPMEGTDRWQKTNRLNRPRGRFSGNKHNCMFHLRFRKIYPAQLFKPLTSAK